MINFSAQLARFNLLDTTFLSHTVPHPKYFLKRKPHSLKPKL